MESIPEGPRPHETAANLLGWSLGAVAICLTVITLIQISDKSEQRLIDEALSALSALFSLIALLNFAYLYYRKNEKLMPWIKRLFLLGMLGLMVSGVLLVIGF